MATETKGAIDNLRLFGCVCSALFLDVSWGVLESLGQPERTRSRSQGWNRSSSETFLLDWTCLRSTRGMLRRFQSGERRNPRKYSKSLFLRPATVEFISLPIRKSPYLIAFRLL